MSKLIYLTEEEFQNREQTICEAGSASQQLEQIQAVYKEVQKHLPDAVLFHGISSTVNNPIYCRVYVGVVRNGITFIMLQNYKDKKYRFEAVTSMFSEAEDSILHSLKEKYPEPCKIGVFTKKKIEDWLTRGISIYKELEEENTVIQNVKAKYLMSLQGEKIEWKDGKQTEGIIRRNGLIFSFSICGRTIYEDIKLSLSYNGKNYPTFTKLADNRY